jgi:hypothetical protein
MRSIPLVPLVVFGYFASACMVSVPRLWPRDNALIWIVLPALLILWICIAAVTFAIHKHKVLWLSLSLPVVALVALAVAAHLWDCRRHSDIPRLECHARYIDI